MLRSVRQQGVWRRRLRRVLWDAQRVRAVRRTSPCDSCGATFGAAVLDETASSAPRIVAHAR